MLSISLGPLALPLLPLLLLASVWLAATLAARHMRRAWASALHTGESATAASGSASAADSAVWQAAFLGLLAARIVFVALHVDAYAATPLALLDIRDGGWWAPAGWLAGAAWLLRCAWRKPPLRPALAKAAAILGLFGLTLVALQRLEGAARMPDVALQGLDGTGPLTLQQAAAGKPAVVNLWATWCAPCRAEMPLLVAAQQRETAVNFVFVNQGESAQTVQRYMAREGLALHQAVLDPMQALGPAVGSRGLPTTLFYDAQGRLIHAHFGVLNAAALETRLQRLRDAD